MIFRIPAGKHRARPLRFGLYWRKSLFTWVAKFDESCRYDLGNDDQFDTNKLVGIGYLAKPRIIHTKRWWTLNRTLAPLHWTDSARFGWLYWQERDQIELRAYCYIKGRREIKHICFCEIGKEYEIKLITYFFNYIFRVINEKRERIGDVSVGFYHKKKLSYRLGCYFGGNKPAPGEIKIQIEKV